MKVKDKETDYIPVRLYREKEVLKIISVVHSTLWNMVRDGTFPSPVRIGARGVAWRSSDINEFIANLESTGGKPGPASPTFGRQPAVEGGER